VKLIGLLVSIAGLSVAGSANGSLDGRYTWGVGWRLGRITAIGVGSDFQEKLAKNCNATLPADQRFAKVRLGGSGHGFWRTVPIQSDAPWRENDGLYINVLDCDAPLIPRLN